MQTDVSEVSVMKGYISTAITYIKAPGQIKSFQDENPNASQMTSLSSYMMRN